MTTTFSIAAPTQIPGERLKPGDYSITVVDHLSDRIVLRVDGDKGKVHDTFLAVRSAELRNSGATGPISWQKGGDHDAALRGFAFAQGGAVEFVYPKAEAVAIAQKNGGTVPAIDPASEGRVAAKNLSPEDRQMVTLWMLSPTTVGSKNATQPAIQAEKYQAPAEPAATTAVAQSAAPAPVATQDAQPTQQVASATPPAPMHRLARLPHTASNLPLILLVGVLSLLCAALLSVGRGVRNAA